MHVTPHSKPNIRTSSRIVAAGRGPSHGHDRRAVRPDESDAVRRADHHASSSASADEFDARRAVRAEQTLSES